MYVWGFRIMRCMYGGIYGCTYDAVLFAHGIGGQYGRSIIHALLLHAFTVCQHARNIGSGVYRGYSFPTPVTPATTQRNKKDLGLM